jgi:amino acid transporter
MTTDAISLATRAEDTAEKRKLQKSFRRFDLIFFTICALIGVDTLGAVASFGGQAITWLLFSALTFLVPYALLAAELGTSFPLEGGVYEWVKMGMGRYLGCVTAVVYWISNPVWVGGTLTATGITAMTTFVSGSFTSNVVLKVLFSLVFIWFSITAAIAAVRYGKWIPTVSAWVRLSMLGFFGLLTVIYGLGHGFHGISFGDTAPTSSVFALAIPVLIFNYVGFELANQASEEMEDPQRDVPRFIAVSGITTVIAYAVPIIAILIVMPASQLTSLGSFVAAYQTVASGVLGPAAGPVGVLIGVAIFLSLVGSSTTWLMGADRTLAITGLDYAAPRFLGYFSKRFGTPIVVNVTSGMVATIFMAFAFATTGTLAQYFAVVLAFVISLTTISYLTIFPTLFILRVKYPDARRPYKVPGGLIGAGVAAFLTTAYSAIATYFLLWPGSLPSGMSRTQYELLELGPLAFIFVLATTMYFVGQASRPAAVRAAQGAG